MAAAVAGIAAAGAAMAGVAGSGAGRSIADEGVERRVRIGWGCRAGMIVVAAAVRGVSIAFGTIRDGVVAVVARSRWRVVEHMIVSGALVTCIVAGPGWR